MKIPETDLVTTAAKMAALYLEGRESLQRVSTEVQQLVVYAFADGFVQGALWLKHAVDRNGNGEPSGNK